VALSRCVSLSGLSLARPVRQDDLRTDPRVARFMADLKKRVAAAPETPDDYEPGCDF
jgi:hypothetical protein